MTFNTGSLYMWRVFTETLCNWMAEGGENINGEQEMLASTGGNILGVFSAI
jgi:hypothetical protein